VKVYVIARIVSCGYGGTESLYLDSIGRTTCCRLTPDKAMQFTDLDVARLICEAALRLTPNLMDGRLCEWRPVLHYKFISD
jgi:hypothetical protein